MLEVKYHSLVQNKLHGIQRHWPGYYNCHLRTKIRHYSKTNWWRNKKMASQVETQLVSSVWYIVNSTQIISVMKLLLRKLKHNVGITVVREGIGLCTVIWDRITTTMNTRINTTWSECQLSTSGWQWAVQDSGSYACGKADADRFRSGPDRSESDYALVSLLVLPQHSMAHTRCSILHMPNPCCVRDRLAHMMKSGTHDST